MKEKLVNQAVIVGRVYDLDEGFKSLQVKTVKNESSENYGKEFIQGTMNVAIDEDGLSIVPVRYTYVTPKFGSGKENTSFAVLKNIIENDLTWASKGKDGAAKVRLTPSLEVNDFVGRDGNIIEAKQLSGGFAEMTNFEKNPLGASFRADAVIVEAIRVEPEDENEKEYMKVKACPFNYRKEIQPIEFRVYNQGGMAFLEDAVSPTSPIFTEISGIIDNRKIKTTWEEESDWGDPIVHERERNIKDWVITKTIHTCELSDESPVTIADLTKAIQNREIHKADVKKDYEDRQKTPAPTSSAAVAASIPTGGFIL